MTREEIALCINQGKYEEIIAYAKQAGVDTIDNANVLIHVGEAYENMAQLDMAVSVFDVCLKKFDEEEAANRILYIAKIEGNTKVLEELITYLEEACVADEALLLAQFELARIKEEEKSEQIELLVEYLDEYPDEKYYVLLLELALESDDSRALSKYLLGYQRDYGRGEYETYANAVKNASENNRKIEADASIKKIIYPPFKKAASASSEKAPQPQASVAQQPTTTATQTNVVTSAPVPAKKDSKKKKKEIKPVSVKEQVTADGKRAITPKDIANLLLGRAKAKKKYETLEPATMAERFEDVVGMESVRQDLAVVYDTLRLQQDRESSDINAALLETTIFSVSGARGAGKTMVAVKIAEMLYDYGIRATEEPLYVEAQDFVEMMPNLTGLEDVTLIIEDIDRCADDQGNIPKEFTDAIYKYLSQMKDTISIIITGNKDSIENMCENDLRIKKLIYKRMEIKPYTLDELMGIFDKVISDKDLIMSDEAKVLVKRQMRKAQYMANFANYYTIDERIKIACDKFTKRYAAEGKDTDIAKVLMIDSDFMMDEIDGGFERYMDELASLTGLAKVKEQVSEELGRLIVAQKAEEQNNDVDLKSDSLHMVFKGGPGTGKTTVARLIGKIYVAAGILPGNGKGVIEVSPSDLVSSYIGETRIKTKNKLNEAMGGVLFIDEAYGLTANQYGKEAIDEIIAVMENCRDSIMIILAGYDEDMDELLELNEGMRSRISTYLNFEDYNEEELLEIFYAFVKNSKFTLAEDTEDVVRELIRYRAKSANFGNARGVRKIVSAIKGVVSNRNIYKNLDGKAIEATDFSIILREDILKVIDSDAKDKQNLEELIADIQNMAGLESLKNMINRYVANVKAVEARKARGQNAVLKIDNLHMIFAGSAGTGKTTAARKMGKIFKGLGILPEGDKIIECSGNDLCGNVVGDAIKNVHDNVNRAMGGILFIDEAYTLLNNTYGKDAIDTILKEMEDKRGKFMVIMAGYAHDMDKLMQSNEGLKSRFNETIVFEDFTPAQLKDIFISFVKADENGYQIEEHALPYIERLLAKESKNKGFANARGVRNTWNRVRDMMDMRVAALPADADESEFYMVKKEDITKLLNEGIDENVSVEDIVKEIKQMIGLSAVKAKLDELVANAKYNLILKKQGLAPEKQGTQHMMFMGNAGTGKTTIARKLGQIYEKLGVTHSSKVVECGREDLVSGYVGQTAGKTKDVLDQALGGILFVDEAYSLIPKGEADYGGEALTTILAYMENHKDDLIVIFAGYERELNALLDYNQGFESRFSSENKVYFEDYTLEEMGQIFMYQMRSQNITVDDALLPDILELIEYRKSQARNFGNARGVRNVADSVNAARRARVVQLDQSGQALAPEQMLTVTKEDILAARKEDDDDVF